jgi:predicted nucleic acid-binding protein
MKILFDTSVLVAALVEPHPFHERGLLWFKKALAKEFELIVCSHTLAECYAVLTTLPVSPRITPVLAWRLIHESIEPISSVTALSASDYFSTVKRISNLGVSGAVIYDALILKAAQKLKADRVLTFNAKDFRRVWPGGEPEIIEP